MVIRAREGSGGSGGGVINCNIVSSEGPRCLHYHLHSDTFISEVVGEEFNKLIGIVCNMGDKVCTIMNRVADSWTSSVYKMREEWQRIVNNGEQINPPNLYPVG